MILDYQEFFTKGKERDLESRRHELKLMERGISIADLAKLLGKNKKKLTEKYRERWMGKYNVVEVYDKNGVNYVKPSRHALRFALGKARILPIPSHFEPVSDRFQEIIKSRYDGFILPKEPNLYQFEEGAYTRIHHLVDIFEVIKAGKVPPGRVDPRGHVTADRPQGNWHVVSGWINGAYYEVMCGLTNVPTGYKLRMYIPPQFVRLRYKPEDALQRALKQMKDAAQAFCKKYGWKIKDMPMQRYKRHYGVIPLDEGIAKEMIGQEITTDEGIKFSVDFSAMWYDPRRGWIRVCEFEWEVEADSEDEQFVLKNRLAKVERMGENAEQSNIGIHKALDEITEVKTIARGILANSKAGTMPHQREEMAVNSLAKMQYNQEQFLKQMSAHQQDQLTDYFKERSENRKQWQDFIEQQQSFNAQLLRLLTVALDKEGGS